MIKLEKLKKYDNAMVVETETHKHLCLGECVILDHEKKTGEITLYKQYNGTASKFAVACYLVKPMKEVELMYR